MNLPTKEESNAVAEHLEFEAKDWDKHGDNEYERQVKAGMLSNAALLRAIARGDLVVCVTAGGVWREERNEVDYDYTPAREIPEPKT